MADVAAALDGDALLSFPLTPFGDDGALDVGALRDHVERQVEAGPSAVFVACGTGELPALGVREVHAVAQAAVAQVGGRVPVLCGAGGGPAIAREMAEAAKDAGVDGMLLLPPYLVSTAGRGLLDHVRHVVRDLGLPTIVYQRANAVLTPAAALELLDLPDVVGVKDGVGDVEAMVRIVTTVRSSGHPRAGSFLFMNGLPTAEVSVLAYRAIGVAAYSSAVLNFAPDLAVAFHRAVSDGDKAVVDRLLAVFYVPFAALRDRHPGYAVALVKCGARLAGHRVGGVRPPLVEPTDDEAALLGELVAAGRRSLAR